MSPDLYIEWDGGRTECSYINYTAAVVDEIMKLIMDVPYGVPYKIYASTKVKHMLSHKSYRDSIALQDMQIHEF